MRTINKLKLQKDELEKALIEIDYQLQHIEKSWNNLHEVKEISPIRAGEISEVNENPTGTQWAVKFAALDDVFIIETRFCYGFHPNQGLMLVLFPWFSVVMTKQEFDRNFKRK